MINLHLVKIRQKSEGFTIVELLIATVVFSMVLLLVTTGVIEMTNVYFKGVADSNTQSVASNVLDVVSQAIQFNGGDITETPTSVTPGQSYVFCIGSNAQFSYMPGYELVSGSAGADQTNNSLIEDAASGCSVQDLTGTVTGRELLGQNMRLSNVQVTCALSTGCNDSPGAVLVYKVDVRVVYGSNDVLYSPSNMSAPNDVQAAEPDATCKGETDGTQFCSVSDLSTIVVKRVQ